MAQTTFIIIWACVASSWLMFAGGGDSGVVMGMVVACHCGCGYCRVVWLLLSGLSQSETQIK